MTRRWSVAVYAALLLLPGAPAAAQVRGLPVFFESTYGYANRLGLQLGHGGELDRISLVAEGSHHFGVGRRRRVSVGLAAGFWDPAGQPLRFTGAVSTQVRLDPAPPAGGIKRFTVRGVTGLALIGDAGRVRVSAPIGIGAGYAFIFPVVHLEPWIVPHLIWARGSSGGSSTSALPQGSDSWKAAISFGVTLGAAKLAGLRFAGECCIDGLAMSYGLSAWF